jgi:hypothetical protein
MTMYKTKTGLYSYNRYSYVQQGGSWPQETYHIRDYKTGEKLLVERVYDDDKNHIGYRFEGAFYPRLIDINNKLKRLQEDEN